MTCSFNGNGIGFNGSGCFQTTLKNCVFEYNGTAIRSEYCEEILFDNCWNEANTNKIEVIGNAKFIGGYNISMETINCENGLIQLEYQSGNKQVFNNNNLIFNQKNGIITKGIQIGESIENLLVNSKFYKNQQAIKVKSFDGWEKYPNWDSLYISDVMYDDGFAYRFELNNISNSPEFNFNQTITVNKGKYKISCYVMSEDRSTIDEGIGMGVIYYNSNNEVIGWDNYIYHPIGNNSWEKAEHIFDIPECAKLGVKFYVKQNGYCYIASPCFSSITNEYKSNLIWRLGEENNNLQAYDINGNLLLDLSELLKNIPTKLSQLENDLFETETNNIDFTSMFAKE